MSDAPVRNPIATPQLSRRTKFIYSLGDWGTSAATVARNTFWFIFLTNVVGIGPGVAGTVVLVGRIWDSINDPLVGTLSDRVQTRWGRRRPFLLFGAVPFGLAFFLMFYVPPIDSTAGLAIYYSFVFLLFDTLYTLVNVPYIALTPELTEDFDERSNLAGWRMGSSILAALITGGTFTLLAEDIFGVWLGGDPDAIRRRVCPHCRHLGTDADHSLCSSSSSTLRSQSASLTGTRYGRYKLFARCSAIGRSGWPPPFTCSALPPWTLCSSSSCAFWSITCA